MEALTKEIEERLFLLQDKKYRTFQLSLIPTVREDSVIGVRTLELRKYAKELLQRDEDEVKYFLREVPHTYFDENQLHAFIISEIKEFDRCIAEVILFLPYVDNWATCDQMSPKIFKKHRHKLMEYIRYWILSEETYTVRFAVGMLMQHYLDEDFDPSYLELVASIRSGEYYINMMIAWYFATALAKQYEAALPYLVDHRLDEWTHNKTIQKASESLRIPEDHKQTLRDLKILK